MAVNTLTFNQLATVLNAVHSQATGKTGITPTNTGEFVSVAQQTLLAGYDPVMNAITQVLQKTIFSYRPYKAKMISIEADARKWGAITRKIQLVDRPAENSSRIPLTDGTSVDQQVIKKPVALQTNYYGTNIYADHITIFKDQIDNALSGPEEFGRFIDMVMGEMANKMEQFREEMARMTVVNLIAGKYAGDPGNVVHLLTEYNTETGQSYTKQDIYQPDKIRGFTEWMFARIGDISDKFEERTEKYQINITGLAIEKHTPKRFQHLYVYSKLLRQLETMVKTETYNADYLNTADVEAVSFWQSIDSPDEIQATPVYLKNDGTLELNASAQTITDVVGVLFDDEAAGYTIELDTITPAVYNAAGHYQNIWYNRQIKYHNDFTEKCVVFVLD